VAARTALRNLIFGLACTVCAAGAVVAGTFQVSPMRIELAGAKPTTILRVTNPGAQPVTLQAEVKAWSYSGEQDAFADTDDVLLNPPIFTIAPGATQFVRVGLRARASPPVEASYRLFLEELPPASQPEEAGVRTLLRISLPVFIAASGKNAAAKVQWSIARAGASEVLLSATNTGNSHIQLQSISLRAPGSPAVASKDLAAYLLPGQTRTWKIPGAAIASATQIELSARSDAGDLSEKLVPTAR
jgi:fimbrial chaperone protein